MTAAYVDRVLMPDLNDPPPKPCCDEARTGFCPCGEWMTQGFPHDHEIEQLRELAVTR